MRDDPRLEELFERWQDKEQPSSIEVCADCPELRDDLEQRLRALADLETFLDLPATATHPSPFPPAVGSSETDSERATGIQPLPRSTPSFAFLDPPQTAGEIGRLGGYRILGVLGEGGMGMVFEAEEPRPRRRVALKVMKPHVAASAEARRRFLQEGQAAATVDHPRIVPIYRVDEVKGVPFLVMPLLKGESLAARLRRHARFPLAEVLRIGREVAEGLAAAHSRRLIHRDVKPANIWLLDTSSDVPTPKVEGGAVLLLDFGLARAPAVHEEPLTREGEVLGSPGYMAPEQAAGRPVEARADLFSLGCILYRLLTGQPAFWGGDLLSTVRSLELDQPKPPREVDPTVPTALSELVMRLLAKNPAGRPASAREVVVALSQMESEPPGDDGPTPRAAPAPPPPTLRRPRRFVLVAGLVLLILVFIGGGMLLLFQKPADSSGVPAPSAEALRGELIVRVWTSDKTKRGLRIGEDVGAVPVREDEQLHLEARLNQPAYVYLLWVDGKGTVTPLYPWNDDKLVHDSVAVAPPILEPSAVVHNPTRLDKGWPLDETSGLDTMLLLARKTPLPSEVRLDELIGKLPQAPLGPRNEVVIRGFDHGQPVAEVKLDKNRRPKGDAAVIDDQLLQLVERLKDHFELIRAVQFAHVK